MVSTLNQIWGILIRMIREKLYLFLVRYVGTEGSFYSNDKPET